MVLFRCSYAGYRGIFWYAFNLTICNETIHVVRTKQGRTNDGSPLAI